MRAQSIAISAVCLALANCATPARYLGSWEYRQGQSYLGIELLDPDQCFVVAAESATKASARCRYAVDGRTIIVTEVTDKSGARRTDSRSFGGPFRFTYRPDDDALVASFEGGPEQLTLVRASKK